MELVLVFTLISFLPSNLIPDWPLSPDDEEVYEAIEDSLAEVEGVKAITRSGYRVRWRVKTDSLNGGLPWVGSFLNFIISQTNRCANLILEKDPGENNWADFWGGGISFKNHLWRFTLGDYIMHFGRGLIFASPYVRSGFRSLEYNFNRGVFPHSAQENRNLRGICIDYTHNRFSLSLLGSYSARDAQLNSDGSVSNLIFSGLHRDSTEWLLKGQVGQLLVGVTTMFNLNPSYQVGLIANGVKYNRCFAPGESIFSFYGQNLGGVGVYLTIGNQQHWGEIELARSFPGGMAGSAKVGLRENGLNLQLTGSIYGNNFFAPAGRAYALTRRFSRTEISGSAGYQQNGFWFRLRANTFYDYMMESIPARLGLSCGYETPPLAIDITTNKKFRYETERLRDTRVDLRFYHGVLQILVYGGDEYLESGDARGRFVGTNFKLSFSRANIAISAAVCDLDGTGISIRVPEPGFNRAGTSYSLRTSGHRFSISTVIIVSRAVRFGIKTGLTFSQSYQPDFGFQIELVN